MAVIQYRIGTVSVTAGATEIVGSGGMDWTTVAKPLDSIAVNGRWTKIMTIVDANHITIEPWPYTTQTDANYVIVTDGLNSFAAPEVAQAVVTLAENLAIEGTYVFVPDNATAPLPYRGDDGQYALQPSTGKLWYKSGGVWSYSGVYKPLGTPALYNSATTYKIMDVVTSNGSSYVYIGASPSSGNAPPNATYWAMLAAKGDTGATGSTGPAAWAAPVAWQTGQSYTAAAPASVVTQGGETYVCIVSHSSGTFATDLAASKWLKIAAKGADGSGTGDMLKADNLSGLANVVTARTNLGATTVGNALFTAADSTAARTSLEIATPTMSSVVTLYEASGTFTKTAGLQFVRVWCVGGGGGSRGSTGDGSQGGTSSFGSHFSATGGAGGKATLYADGGTGVNGDINLTGGLGNVDSSIARLNVGGAGAGPFGSSQPTISTAVVKYGGGGATSVVNQGGGGGGGASYKVIPASSLASITTVTVGAGGAKGTGTLSNDGDVGVVIVEAVYLS